MKKISFFLFIVPILLTTLGAGCALGGSSSEDTSKDGGVYKSTDNGALWAQVTAYPTAGGVGNIGTAEVLSMAADPQDREVIYAGTSENGLLISYDSAGSWQSPKDEDLQKNRIVAIAVDPKNMCTVYTASKTSLFKTETCGREFSSVYDEARNRTEIKQIAIDWYNDGTLYLGLSNGDILKSVNNGNSWTQIAALGKNITALVISNQDSRIVLAGAEGGLWKSIDAGATWTEKTDILKSFKSADKIFSVIQDAAGATWLLSSEYGILRSADSGDSWAGLKLLTSAGQVEIKSLAMDQKDTGKIYYTTETNFYSSSDGGNNWDTTKLENDGWIVSTLLLDSANSQIIYLGKKKK